MAKALRCVLNEIITSRRHCFLLPIVQGCLNHFSMDSARVHMQRPIKMEIEKRANRQHTIQPPPIHYI